LIVFWGQVGAEPLKNIKAVKKECRTSSTVSVGGRTFQAAYSDARRVAHANNYTVKMQKTVQLMDGSYVSVVEVNKKSILNKKLINE
jgi:hypothetical protein